MADPATRTERELPGACAPDARDGSVILYEQDVERKPDEPHVDGMIGGAPNLSSIPPPDSFFPEHAPEGEQKARCPRSAP